MCVKKLFLFIFTTLLLVSCASTKGSSASSLKEQSSYFAGNVSEQHEYERSVSALASEGIIISAETFASDKQEILKIIADLSDIIKTKDYNKWVGYLTPESVEYWSNQKNLSELSLRLYSNYNYKLKNLKEYFEKFFIPSRKGRVVDEIRYVTPTVVKAVQYKDDQDIIYYFFEKRGDEWLLKLDTLSS